MKHIKIVEQELPNGDKEKITAAWSDESDIVHVEHEISFTIAIKPLPQPKGKKKIYKYKP